MLFRQKYLCVLFAVMMFFVSGAGACHAGWIDTLFEFDAWLGEKIGGRAAKVVFSKAREDFKLLTVEELTERANNGNVDAQFKLGMMYLQNVTGSELSDSERMQKGVDWMSRAVDEGDSEAASVLGILTINSAEPRQGRDTYKYFYLAYLLDKNANTKHNVDIWEEPTLWGFGSTPIPEDERKEGRAEAEKMFEKIRNKKGIK